MMKRHLTAREAVDALDGALALSRQAHLDTCATCERAVETLRATQADAAEGTEIPEPSPLFWTHFSDRVREAVSAEPIVQPSLWSRFWQPAAAVAAIGVVAVMIANAPWTPVAPASPEIVAAAAETPDVFEFDNDAWTMMLEIAGAVPGNATDLDAVRDAMKPRPGTADRMIESLTPEQREAFIKLLKSEMGTLE